MAKKQIAGGGVANLKHSRPIQWCLFTGCNEGSNGNPWHTSQNNNVTLEDHWVKSHGLKPKVTVIGTPKPAPPPELFPLADYERAAETRKRRTH